MKKLLLIILLIIGFSYSQGINTSVIYLIENYNFSEIDIDTVDVDYIRADEFRVTHSTSTDVSALPIYVSETLSGDFGDASTPAYGMTVYSKILGDDLLATKAYEAAVTGLYGITGTNVSDYPKAGVLGWIADNTTTADGAFIALIDGDTQITQAGAAYGVRHLNSTPTSGFDYGLDLYGAAIDDYNAVSYRTADIRLSKGALFNNSSSDLLTITEAVVAISGDLTATNLTGTLQTAAQTNITSVGTLTSLLVSGDITTTDNTKDVGSSGTPFNLVYADSVHANWFGGSDFKLGESGYDITIDADSIKGSPVWAGDLVVTGNQTLFGEMEAHESGNTLTIGITMQNYGVQGEASAGELNGFTFVSGSTGQIASVASISAGDSTNYTDVEHGLLTGDYVTINTVNHSGITVVVREDADNFRTGINFVGDETGFWFEGDYLLASAGTAGKFLLAFDMSFSAGNPTKEYHCHVVQNATALEGASIVETVVGTNHSHGATSAIVTVTAADRFWIVVENETDAENFLYEDLTLLLHKL